MRPAIGLLEDEAKPAHLFGAIRREIPLVAEQIVQQVDELRAGPPAWLARYAARRSFCGGTGLRQNGDGMQCHIR
jgi:hypothetical protein